MDNVTFLWFLLFSMCKSLHVAVKMYINYSFFYIYNNNDDDDTTIYKAP